jgi:hypothetical protein
MEASESDLLTLVKHGFKHCVTLVFSFVLLKAAVASVLVLNI